MAHAKKADRKVAHESSVVRRTAQRWRQNAGLDPVDSVYQTRHIAWDEVFLERKEHETSTIRELADRYEVTRTSVARALKKRGLEARPGRSKTDWENILVKQRLHETLGTRALSEKLGVPQNTVQCVVYRWKKAGKL